MAPRRRKGGDGEPVRDALVRAGQSLFSRKPVDAVSIDDLVREARVAKGSFYKHFADKEDLLAAVIRGIFTRIEQEVAVANAEVSDAAVRVCRGICVYLRYVADEPEQGGVLVRNNRSGWTFPIVALNPGAMADVRRGLLAGRFVVPTVEAGTLVVEGVAHVGLTRFNGESDATSNADIAQQLCQLVLSGLGIPAAEAAQVAMQATDDVLRQPRSPGGLADVADLSPS